MADNRNNFTIRSRARLLPDGQKSWLWQVTILNIAAIIPNVMSKYGSDDASTTVTEEDLRVRCRSVSLPLRDHEDILQQFMSTKQHSWGRPIADGICPMTFEETNDQKIRQIFHAWSQKMVNTDPSGQPNTIGVGGAGQSVAVRSIDLKTDILIEMYNYNGDHLMQDMILFGAFPKTVGEITMNYTDSSILQFNITFQFDYHLLNINDIYW